MKAPTNGYRITPSAANTGKRRTGGWIVTDDRQGGRVVWQGATYTGARTAHYRLSVARSTGKPVSYLQARRAGN